MEKTFNITGTVSNKNNQALPHLRIEAWDKDLIFNDFVGEAISAADGFFQISFSQNRFKELFFDNKPDIYFKVYSGDKLIVSTENSVLWNIENEQQEVKIIIDRAPDSTGDQTPAGTIRENAVKLKSLDSLKGIKLLKENELELFFSSPNDNKALLISQWEDQKRLNKEDAAVLNNTISLLRAAQNNADALTAFSKAGIHKTLDLIQHNRQSLVAILSKNKIDISKGQDINAYADEVLFMAEAENPSAFFMHRIMEKPEWLNLDTSSRPSPSNQFKAFYASNKTFDLKNEPIISLETGELNKKIEGVSRPSAALVKELSYAQQSLQLSDDSNMAALLFAKEINIKKAVTSTKQSLIRELGIDAEEAQDIKQKAQYYHESAMNGYLAYREIISNPYVNKTLGNLAPAKDEILRGIGKDDNWVKVKEINGLKDIDSIEDLFGSQNYCECESCKSVLSPAAYFVDLMRFTEKRVLVQNAGGADIKLLPDNHSIHLKVRRPDLWKLELTCDNTNKRIPYVEIINEVISTFIGKQLGVGKTIPQRLIEEMPDLEFTLPYNQALDEVRIWLSYFKLTRLEVLEYLYPTPDAAQKLMIAIENLNLSKEQYNIIINQNLNAKADINVLSFRKKSGLSSEETEQLTKMKFWDNKLSIVQKKDAGDIQKFHIEFSTTLPNWQAVLHRIIRLWKASKWPLKDFDLILQAYTIKHGNLNNAAILNLASFRKIQSLLKLEVPVLVGILKGLQEKNDDTSVISWELLLPSDWIKDDAAHLDDLLANADDDSFNLLLRLQGTFGVGSADMLACLDLLKDKIGAPIAPNGPINIVFNTDNLNQIYRYIQLYKWTTLASFEVFTDLLEVWGKGIVKYFDNPNDDIPVFVRFIDSFKVTKISIDDLVYLFGKELKTAEVVEEDKEALNSDEIKNLLADNAFANGDKFSLLFNKWTAIDTDVLSYYKHFIEVSNADLDNLYTDLVGATTDATYIKLSNIKRRLERLEFLIGKFKIDIDTLKIIATEIQDCVYLKLGFGLWQDMDWVKELAYLGSWIEETKNLRNFDLWLTLRNIEKENPIPLITQKAIAKWKQIDLTQVAGSIAQTNSLKTIKNTWDYLDWAKKLNVSTELINKLKTGNNLSDLEAQSQMLQHAIRSKFSDNETWETQIQDFKNKLSSNKRDALCNYVIFNKDLRAKDFGFDDREDLYRYFLLDVSMGDCFTLPRIVAASNSVQVYVNRCIMGFEKSKDETVSIILDIDEMEEWEWRKHYRVWEANRKIFLFPENYAEPEIRDNKSPEFKELEDELLQQKLNLEVVENAYKKYVQQIMTLAELKMAGAYHDKEDNKIYLFGKTNKQPTEYYYRHVEFLENGGALWSNWEKMNIAIPSEDVSAIRYNGKLYIFWTTFQRKDISDVKTGTQTIRMHTYDVYANYSYLQVDKKWCAPQKIELKYRRSSAFDPYLRIDKYKNEVNAGDVPTLKPTAEEIRENVLKEFEKTVYRKPYPSETKDSNILSLDFIWTDKKDAIQASYINTKAVIDAFTITVKLKVDMPILGDVTFDIDFSFDRFDQIVNVANTPNQSAPPPVISISPKTFVANCGDDKLYFIFTFNQDGTKYTLKTGDSAANKFVFFDEPNKDIRNGDVDLIHRIDYKPISALEYERNLIKLADQKKVTSSLPQGNASVSLEQEYNTYYDSFTNFFVTDGTNDYADGVNDYKILQKDLVAVLSTPENPNSNDALNLNPEKIQFLWDKLSLSINDLLDYKTQNEVSAQIDYSKSFGNYFFELFFHIPMRIADHLNAAGKYRDANQWYSYIYNPTAMKDKFEQLVFPHDVNWRFAAFRNIGIKKLQEIYSDPNAIEMYQRNPGNPHAIARLRIGAYQKNVVMKYLDNLMDWADYLFAQYTPESTSEARHLYDIVKTILGDKPEKTGACKETKVFTYSDINVTDNSDFIYNLFGPTRKKTKSKIGSHKRRNKKAKPGSSNKKMHNDSRQIKTVRGKKMGKDNPKPDRMQAVPQNPPLYFDLDTDLIFCFPHNKDFMLYWDRVNDRIFKLNNCLDINGVKKLMPAFAPEIDPALLARMVAGGLSFDEIIAAMNGQLPNHRFVYLIEKAKQFCGTVQSFGSALFAAIEKRDGEELTLLRTRHEQNIMTLTSKNKKRQIDQARANYANLLESKTNIENRKTHYENLIDEGLIEWENVEQIAKWTSGSIRITEGVLHLLSGGLALIPQVGSPFAMKYGGVELSSNVSKFANALDATAKIADNVAILAGLEGSHQRREQDWKFQMETANQELLAIGQQLRSSEIAVTMAEFDFELHNTNIEHYKELYEFYTSKFSNFKHYTFQVQQMQKLYRMAFNLAGDLASQAQKAFEFERFGTQFNSGFIKPDNWNSEKSGLLAGEQLMLQLLQLEKEFIDTDKRKMEITQHFSMLQLAPDKLYQLKTIGECVDFSIPEAAFDLTYPGYFRRIIKSVRVSIPCIAGPYTNIGATLTLGTNKIRKSTDINNDLLSDFPFDGCEMIATSNAQNDGGQFELNFRDERYLPFEGAGAVSSWTLSLPKVKQAFDYATISDVIFHISYTADYDGAFKGIVEADLIAQLNTIHGNGLLRAFSLRHDFPLEWNILSTAGNNADVVLDLKTEHFPYFTNMDGITSIEPNCFTIGASKKLELMPDNEGITKENKMKVKVPKAAGTKGYKDLIFLVKYLVK